MERFRRIRGSHSRVSSPLKVTTIVDQSSKDWNISTTQTLGKEVVGNQNKLRKSESHLSTCSSSITTLEENQLSFDLERSSTDLSGGTTMKKLLADELAKETESGRRSPSIIARLMGLDGLPVPHSSSKKQKKLSDVHQRGSSSGGFSKSGKAHDRSHKKNAMAQQPLRDVYEVVDRSNIETSSSTSRGTSNRNFREEEIDFIRRKFMDAKRFSTDEKLQHSKEYHDALEVLDSNKDLFLKFLQEPDSLLAKHLHDLHDARESYYGCNQGTNSNNALKCNIDVIGCQTAGEDSQKIDISHSHKHWSSCYCSMYDRHSTDIHQSSFLEEGNEDSSSNPTKIVVLKPNLGRVIGIAKSASSNTPYRPHSNFELYNECSNLKHVEPKVRDRRRKNDDFDIYSRKSREPRELAREITRRMRDKLGAESLNVSSSVCKGYSADESSHDTSDNDSSYESEVTIVSSRTSSNRKIHSKASVLGFTESSVNIEAKKRLSERWKMAHRSDDFGASSKGNTLAEMLAIPDVDIRPRSPDTAAPQEDYFHIFGRKDGTAKFSTPLGISSRDGWKDGCSQNLSRSRSLPASANHLGSPKSSTKHGVTVAKTYLSRKESSDHAKNKVIKRHSRRKAGSFSESRKPSDDIYEKSQSSCFNVEMIDDLHEIQSSGNAMNVTEEKDSPEVKSVILELSSCRQDTQLTLNAVDVKEQKNVSKIESALEIPSCVLPQDCSCTCNVPYMPQVGGSCLQCAATHTDSPASCKEPDQPSPVSVLEVPLAEDLSSGSECFERVSAELLGLRKQLQLLKNESEVYDEGSMLVSSDEYGDESTEMQGGKYLPRVGECWESCYLGDVLTLSGVEKADFLGTWHCPDSPIGPWVFEELEKRYGDIQSCDILERKLLFDHINAQIVEISQQYMDLEAWVTTPRKCVGSQRLKDVLETELRNLLEMHENKAANLDLDTMILSNMRWMKLGKHIGDVGREIAALLIDELIAESVPV